MEGTIKKLVSDKGFGFISVKGQQKDTFFHASALVNSEFDTLQEGERVSFEIEQGAKGPKAANIRVLS